MSAIAAEKARQERAEILKDQFLFELDQATGRPDLDGLSKQIQACAEAEGEAFAGPGAESFDWYLRYVPLLSIRTKALKAG